MYANCRAQRGSVLIMAIIIGSGMLVAAVEVSMFVVSTIRQARAIDHTLVAFYAAESGVENALFQVRKEFEEAERTALRQDSLQSLEGLYHSDGRDARWTFGAPDGDKFSSTVQKITKDILGEQQSIDIHLWTHENGGFFSQKSDFKTMTVRWRKTECVRADEEPWIETTALVFEVVGGGITWPDSAQSSPVKKDFTKPTGGDTPNSVSVDLASFFQQTGGQIPQSTGMTLRIKPFFCALRDVEIFFPQDGATDPLPIPNYYLINPVATFGSVSTNLQVIMPKYEGATGIFDYLLFSEENVEKVEE